MPLAMYMYGVSLEYMLFMAPALLLGLWAQWLVKSRITTFSGVANQLGITGHEVAERILAANGIRDVRVEPTDGWLSDHYSPGEKALRLSPEIYGGRSVSALAVAAHEVGHAIQDHKSYPMLGFRSFMAPAASIGSSIGMYMIPIGFMLGAAGLVYVGIALFSITVLFTLITLPVEFDASRRALQEMERLRLSGGEEWYGARKVLTAAAMTYVAAAVSAAIQLAWFLFQAGLLGGRRQSDET